MYGRAHIDSAVLENLRDIMAEDYPALLEAYLGDSEERLLLLRQALRDDNAEGLRTAAHSFKGSCSNMGAQGLVQLCLALERAGRDEALELADGLLRQLEQELSVVRVLIRAERRRYA